MVTPRNLDLSHMQDVLIKDFAKRHGYVGARGGWIYRQDGSPVAQGWSAFYRIVSHKIMDEIVTANTAFCSFTELINAERSYRPTFKASQDWRLLVLASEYNHAMEARRDPRRATVTEIPESTPQWFRRWLTESPTKGAC